MQRSSRHGRGPAYAEQRFQQFGLLRNPRPPNQLQRRGTTAAVSLGEISGGRRDDDDV
ncbi:hypothetical protein Syun_027875 [Stephania yunnanensis]|uniref:Uncharacterized protein n=1 Tax=Stephania yunnanensis TaxID=152371 RepID=A0AAP0EQ93_9MAGN